MFKLFNKPAIDDAVTHGKTIRFSHHPDDYPNTALNDEWKYLQDKYKYYDLKKKGDYWYAIK